jgi:hypothetical protein
MHTVCFTSMCAYISQTSNEAHNKSQVTWSALVLEALSHDAVLRCAVLCCAAHLLTAAICVCCVVVALQKEAQRALKRHQNFSPGSIPPSWSFQILPTLYQHYQKVETIKHCKLLLVRNAGCAVV